MISAAMAAEGKEKDQRIERIASSIRVVPNFPKPGLSPNCSLSLDLDLDLWFGIVKIGFCRHGFAQSRILCEPLWLDL